MMEKSRSAAADASVIYVSRQPIYSRSGDLFAYELLYPFDLFDNVLAAKDEKSGDEFFQTTFLKEALEPLVDDALAFIGVTRTFALRDYCRALPKEKVVLEIPRLVESDEAVSRLIKGVTDLGYTIGLDDFDSTDQNRPLLEVATYVNLNFGKLPGEEIYKQLSMLKHSNVRVIATRVDTPEQFESATSMGFEYFRGSCFTRPKLATQTRVSVNRLSTLQLVLKLQEPELSTAELERIISQDLAISYKLLQYVNSAALSISRNIESIRTAIQMAGREHLRAWASLLFLSKLDDKPAEVSLTAVIRAKMAEGLAVAMGAKTPETYYMVGLFSLVDALLNVPMPEAIQLLPFSKEVREALVVQAGPLGSVLKCVLAYERGDWSEVACGDLDAATIQQCYLSSIASARNMPKITKSVEAG
jgi:c-di-GMP-related signal transduction protein